MPLQTLPTPDAPRVLEVMLRALLPSVACNKCLCLGGVWMSLGMLPETAEHLSLLEILFCFSYVEANAIHRGSRFMTFWPLVTASLVTTLTRSVLTCDGTDLHTLENSCTLFVFYRGLQRAISMKFILNFKINDRWTISKLSSQM